QNGQQVWASSSYIGTALELDQLGNIYVGSSSAILKYDNNGNQLWDTFFPGTRYVYPVNLTLVGDDIFTSRTRDFGTNDFEFVAAKYHQTPDVGLPLVLSEPQRQNVLLGGSLALSVSVSNEVNLTYQWKFNRADIP